MATRKVVRTLSYSGIELPIISSPPCAPVEADEAVAAAFGDESKTRVISNCPTIGDFTVQVLDEGGTPPTVGASSSITVTTTYGDGSSSGDATRAQTLTCQIKSVTAGTVAVDGERKATFDIVVTPTGGVAPSYGGSTTSGA